MEHEKHKMINIKLFMTILQWTKSEFILIIYFETSQICFYFLHFAHSMNVIYLVPLVYFKVYAL